MSVTYSDLQYTSFPDSIQTFVTMLNMVATDAAAINGYQAAMRNGDMSTAQSYLAQLTNGNQKILDAEKINTLLDTCVALERFYSSDIAPYISGLQTNWENVVNQFSYKGDWNNVTTYQKNNFVTANVDGVYGLYLCIANSAYNIVVTNTSYWRPLTVRGTQGASGTTMSFRFNWSSSETYYVDDVVTYNDAVWSCIAQNNNQAPTNNSAYWVLIYRSSQQIYPFGTVQPTGLTTGSLWLEQVV